MHFDRKKVYRLPMTTPWHRQSCFQKKREETDWVFSQNSWTSKQITCAKQYHANFCRRWNRLRIRIEVCFAHSPTNQIVYEQMNENQLPIMLDQRCWKLQILLLRHIERVSSPYRTRNHSNDRRHTARKLNKMNTNATHHSSFHNSLFDAIMFMFNHVYYYYIFDRGAERSDSSQAMCSIQVLFYRLEVVDAVVVLPWCRQLISMQFKCTDIIFATSNYHIQFPYTIRWCLMPQHTHTRIRTWIRCDDDTR